MLDTAAAAADDAADAAAYGIIPRLTLASSASAAHLTVVSEFLVHSKPANDLHLPQRVKMEGCHHGHCYTVQFYVWKRIQGSLGFMQQRIQQEPCLRFQKSEKSFHEYDSQLRIMCPWTCREKRRGSLLKHWFRMTPSKSQKGGKR